MFGWLQYFFPLQIQLFLHNVQTTEGHARNEAKLVYDIIEFCILYGLVFGWFQSSL